MKHKALALSACLVAALSTPTESAAQQAQTTEDWKAVEEQAKAEQAAYAALKARYDAELAAAKAQMGPLADYATAGSVEAPAGSGKLETQLLAASALRRVSDAIAGQIVAATATRTAVCGGATPSLQDKETHRCGKRLSIVVGTEADKLSFDSYEAFLIQLAELDQGLERALYLKPDPPAAGSKPGEAATSSTMGVTGIATALSVAGNLLRSDYKLAGVDLAATNDTLLAKMVAGRAMQVLPDYDLILPNMLIRPVATQSANPARAKLDNAAAKRTALAQTAEGNRQKAGQGGTGSAAYTAVAIKQDAMIKRFDDFVTKISSADANGQVPLLAIARQSEIAQRLGQGGLMLFVKTDYQGGTTYSKKNFFTFFGGMPFYASGGVLVSYTLIEGTTGRTVAVGDLEDITPFTSIGRIGRRAEPPR